MKHVNKRYMGGLRALFTPDYHAPSITSINFKLLHRTGIRAAAIDADRTLLPFKDIAISKDIRDYLLAVQDAGYIKQLVIASNRRQRDLNDAAKSLSTVVVQANNPIDAKPFRAYYKRLFRKIQYKPYETVMIGDKRVTDIVGGNAYGMPTLLVDKIQ